ncbi:MAG TPA: hypothetical protein VFB77_08420 [Acidimicrobiales bacterium]|nr:hypothetical protein [Acidimicrobiales bacterium]
MSGPEPAWPSANGHGRSHDDDADARWPRPAGGSSGDGIRLDDEGWPAEPPGVAGSRSPRPPDASGWTRSDDDARPDSSGWSAMSSSSPRQVFVPAPEDLEPQPPPARPRDGWGPPEPGAMRPSWPPPLSRPTVRRGIDRRRLAVVYDIDGPRVRLGVAWFAGAMAATLVSAPTTALLYAAVAGLAARQMVKAWGSVSWQADVAAGIGAVPVLAALVGVPFAVSTAGLAVAVAIGCAMAPDGERLPGAGGRLAAAGIMCLGLVPALAGAAFVLVRVDSVVAAVVLLLMVSAYEAGDYIVGSGASNPVEGPLAGITTSTLVALPMALVLVEPFDAAGVGLLAFAAVACPLGQIVASAALPGAAAYAPALRRIDTLLVLAPVWAAAAGAF